jgi:hypothetical protein
MFLLVVREVDERERFERRAETILEFSASFGDASDQSC